MSDQFRTLLQKVGSGTHTSKDLSRQDAAVAMQLMLTQSATPAQIGAFMIAHRIKRPTPEELAGMMDAYDALGQRLQPIQSPYPVTVFNAPYDGRSRTAPVSPLTALILAAADCPVVMHGGDRMPTKYGLPLIEVWQGLGVDWSALTLAETQRVFEQTYLGFVYLPRDFPLAQGLTPYRDQIGKRPPMATVELMWSPYAGKAHVVSGFVHPPTEDRTRAAFGLRDEWFYTTVKGLEGSCDLPRDRTAIVGLGQPASQTFERLTLPARDYGFTATDVSLGSTADLIAQIQAVLTGTENELMQSALWNSGFYLWRCGACPSLAAGIEQARQILTCGSAAQQLQRLRTAIAQFQPAVQV